MDRRTCTVVIPTHNRKDDLRRTLAKLRSLDPRPDAVIVCLDGCTDGSAQMLAEAFPECQVISNETNVGSIPSRDRAFRLVTTDLIVSLDDDSYPLDRDFVTKISDVVEHHPEAGAFTFPEIRNNGRPANPTMGPNSIGHYVPTFPNCAGVMLRELYGSVAQYPTFFSHAYAEPDYCLQLYASSFGVWFEPSI